VNLTNLGTSLLDNLQNLGKLHEGSTSHQTKRQDLGEGGVEAGGVYDMDSQKGEVGIFFFFFFFFLLDSHL